MCILLLRLWIHFGLDLHSGDHGDVSSHKWRQKRRRRSSCSHSCCLDWNCQPQSDQLLDILLELSLVFTGHSLLACSFTSQLCTSRVFPCASAIFWSMEPQAKPLAPCGCIDTSDGYCAVLSYSEHDSLWSVDNLMPNSQQRSQVYWWLLHSVGHRAAMWRNSR